MIKLKKILLEMLDITDSKEPLRAMDIKFVIGPDGKIWVSNDHDEEFHGHALLEYPILVTKFMEDNGFDEDEADDIINRQARKGDSELYKWLYKNGFIRGGYNWFEFSTITNKQKDSIINLIENNKKRFEHITAYIHSGTAYNWNKYSLKDFWRKYLI